MVLRFSVITCLAACGSLVDTSYAGEPLLRLRGVVSSQGGNQPIGTDVRAALLWQGVQDTGVTGFTRLPLSIEFPTFSIDVLSVPRDEVLFQVATDEPAIGEAYLHIVRPGTGPRPSVRDFVATDYDHALVYVSAEVPPSGLTSLYLGAAVAPGFHVMFRTSTADLTAPQQLLVERCVALALDTPPARALASCTAQHAYRLEPSPTDLATILEFRWAGSS
jgi:hypothetical protein